MIRNILVTEENSFTTCVSYKNYCEMAKNNPIGDNARKGAVKNRTQVYNPVIEHWVKRNPDTGRFMDVKTSDSKPFKGVRKEK